MSAPPATSAKLPAEHGRLIALLVVSSFVVILNETIMSVALPELMRDLDIPATTAQWLTTGFLLTMAVVIPITGFLLQRFQIRQIYVAAMTAFTMGTLIAALAPGFEVLLAGRIVQAVGTALMLPLLMTTVMTLVPEARRGQMMGTITIVIAVAPAIGPTISGLVLEAFDWRWMFWFVLPFAVAALAIGARWVQNVTEPHGAHLDYASVVLSAIGFSGLVYGLSSIGEAAQGDTPLPPAVPLAIGVVGLALFVRRQLRLGDRALLDLRVFASPLFTIAAALTGLSMLTLLGALIVLPLYLQNVLDLSTLTTGLILLPGGLTMGLLGPFVGRAYDRVGPRPLVLPAAVIVAVALALMAMMDGGTSVGFVVAAHVVLSVGLALMFTPLMTTALGAVPPQRYSHGSAIVSTLQQVSGAAGAAIFITVMTRRATSASDAGTADPGALAEGVQSAMLVGVGLAAVAGVVALFLRRPKPPELPPAVPVEGVVAAPGAAGPVDADKAEDPVSV